MKNSFLTVFVFTILFSCNSENQKTKKLGLNSELESCFLNFREIKTIVGSTGFGSCFDDDLDCIIQLENKASITDLQYMNNDTLTSNEFKVFLWSLMLKRDSVIGNKILQQHKDDNKLITRSTGCFGIVFTRSIRDEVKLLNDSFEEVK